MEVVVIIALITAQVESCSCFVVTVGMIAKVVRILCLKVGSKTQTSLTVTSSMHAGDLQLPAFGSNRRPTSIGGSQ